jgi:hypothetical protein
MAIEYFGNLSHPKAIVIRSDEKIDGIQFFSPEDYSQQIGLMTRPEGYVVPAHVHNQVERVITATQEVLIIRKGECVVTLISQSDESDDQIHLTDGDTILLAHGAHKIEMLSDCEILEIKQGPYAGGLDKTLIQTIS